MIGEVHIWTPVESYAYLMDAFSDQFPDGHKCLAVEFPATTRSFESILSELKTRAGMVRLYPEMFGSPKEAEIIAKEYEMVALYSSHINQIAHEKGFKVILVDHTNKYKELVTFDQRNQAMADNITWSLKNSDCDAVLGIFGKKHVSRGSIRPTDVQYWLNKNGISPTTINLQATDENKMDLVVRSFEKSKIIPSTDWFLWIESSVLDRVIKLFPYMPSDDSTWNEFTYTLIVPTRLQPITYDK